MKTIASVLAVLLVSIGAAQAESYCRLSQSLIFSDGGTYDVDWEVTQAGVRQVQTLMHQKPSTGCNWNVHTVGGLYRAPEVVQQPRLGRATFPSRYRLFYRADRPGKDDFAIRLHWLNRTGSPNQAVIRFHVTVSPTAL